jgi:endo-1,4-beta-xylanase
MWFRQSSAKRLWAHPLALFAALVSIASLTFPMAPSLDVAAAEAEVVTATDVDAKALAPQATVIAAYDFETGTTEGWGARGPVTVTAVSTTAYSGTWSLEVTGRSDTWQGASIEILGLLEAGATYEISGCVKLLPGEPDNRIKFTVQEDSSTYVEVANSGAGGVTQADWVCMQGPYSFDTTPDQALLYVEAPDDANVSYYLDTFSIIMTAAAPSAVIAEYNFDDDTTQGWVAHTDTVTTAVAVVSNTFRSSPNSLLTTGRSAGWHGAEVDVTSLLAPGVTYEISGCVRLVTGEPDSRLIFSMASTVITDTTYSWIVRSEENGVTDDEWTCLHGQYAPGAVDQLILFVESDSAAADVEFYLDDVMILSPPLPPIQTDIPSVYETYSTTFLIGAALEPDQLNSIRHTELLTRHFNSLTAENVMKPGPIHPSEGTYNWENADRLANFARANDMVIHGHTLVWHQQAANWMFQDDEGNSLDATLENKELVLDRLRTHVYSVTERYGDVVNVWDVVNEVIDPAQTDCMYRSEWYRLTGTDYISVAFNAAHEKVPTATLILNDYGTTSTTKRECIYTVVQDLLDQDVPISGIGMQMHVNVENPSPAAIEATIERFAELSVEVHITELDMSIYTSSSDAYATAADVPEELLITQGHRYKEIFDIFVAHDDVESVTFWGMADDHTWLTNRPIPRVDLPLLFDQQQQAKYAYWGIIDPDQLPVLIQQLNASQGTPTIDGSSEFLWDILPWTEIGATEELTASFQTRWDADYLYVIVDVEDATDDVTDTVEIFIDESNDKAETYDPDDVHYTYQNGVCSPTVEVTCTAQATANGYLLEAALPFSGTASVGMQIGFDVRVTDGSQPAFPISWNDPTHSQDTTPANWGTLTFIDAFKTTEAIHGLPIIDAVEDDAWAGASVITTNVLVEGAKESTATVKTMWGAGNLYVYAVVSDTFLTDKSSNAWEQDSIEVFVDQNNAKTSSYQTDDSQYRVNYNNVQSVGDQTSVDDLTSATRILTTTSIISPSEVITLGYVVELAIRLDEVAPSDGVVIGFDFQVNNDNNDTDGRDGVVTWHDPTGQSYQNTSRLGVLVFTGIEYTNYLPVIARNADMSGDASKPDRHYLR